MDYHSSESEDEGPRELNKKLCRKLAKRIVPIKNSDKKYAEGWTPSRAKDIGNWPNPSRILLLGPCNVGKSTCIKNLILHQRPKFQEVYIVHEDAEFTTEYDDLDPTEMMSELPDIDYWENLPSMAGTKRCLVIDDLELTSANKQRLKNLALLFRYVSSHKNLTIYFAHQSFFNVIPIVKKMANVYIVYKPRAYSELSLIEDRVGMPKGGLKQLFNTIATGHRDSITVDLTENTPSKLRLNIWKKIKSVSSDSDNED